MPWEKDKHYRMLYRLEKKYFPEQSLDNAFVAADAAAPAQPPSDADKGLVFFEEEKKEGGEVGKKEGADKGEVLERKVEEFFRALKKGPGEGKADDASTAAKKKAVLGGAPRQVKRDAEREEEDWPRPHLASTRTELPPRWDGPTGTVVLIDKPKGDVSSSTLMNALSLMAMFTNFSIIRVDLIYCLWKTTAVGESAKGDFTVFMVGHAGTLDPMATGLLIVCVGKATKVVDRYQGMVKGYSGVFRLGEATSTWDADSPVIQRESWEHIKDEDIRKAAASFMGEIWQVPPMFSAIKCIGTWVFPAYYSPLINQPRYNRFITCVFAIDHRHQVGGEKMYDKARRGESVELSPRRISIYKFDIERSLEDRQNLIFRVTCSKGTYIRSLCADLGKALRRHISLFGLENENTFMPLNFMSASQVTIRSMTLGTLTNCKNKSPRDTYENWPCPLEDCDREQLFPARSWCKPLIQWYGLLESAI
ncbi:tRNA pseudouridine synthase B [Triticum urartu]|uniref:tRNA pseudouridine(55) synthase n=1 Tax=Triticum urartu TaxID=4572 RepID=M8AF11_TRIUA|nr:tRNA pseudouridine synthase B [Triticum urartu]